MKPIETFRELTLEQYAGIATARDEGFPLQDALAQEGFDPANWPAAEQAWRTAIAGTLERQIHYAAACRRAEDHLSREVEPLDRDPAAWAGLLGQLATAKEPAKIIEALGLRASDLGRLGRRWNERAAADPAVAEKLTALAGKASPPVTVRTKPARLTPFPWSKNQAPPTETGSEETQRAARPYAGGTGDPAADVDLYAALCAVRDHAPAHWLQAIALVGIDAADWKALDARWEHLLANDPDLRAIRLVAGVDHRTAVVHLLAGATGVLSDEPVTLRR